MDLVAMGVPCADRFRLRLHAFYGSKTRKPIEEQSIAATNVKDTKRCAPTKSSPQRVDDDLFPRAPPPMMVVELGIFLDIFLVHALALDHRADLLLNDVYRPPLHLFVNARDVCADDAEEEQIHARDKGDEQRQSGEALWRLMQNEFCDYGIDRENDGENHGEGSDDGGGVQRSGGEREDPVRGESQQTPRRILALACFALGALDGDPDLPEADPAPQSPGVAKVL